MLHTECDNKFYIWGTMLLLFHALLCGCVVSIPSQSVFTQSDARSLLGF